jgi:hypothetical protein
VCSDRGRASVTHAGRAALQPRCRCDWDARLCRQLSHLPVLQCPIRTRLLSTACACLPRSPALACIGSLRDEHGHAGSLDVRRIASCIKSASKAQPIARCHDRRMPTVECQRSVGGFAAEVGNECLEHAPLILGIPVLACLASGACNTSAPEPYPERQILCTTKSDRLRVYLSVERSQLCGRVCSAVGLRRRRWGVDLCRDRRLLAYIARQLHSAFLANGRAFAPVQTISPRTGTEAQGVGREAYPSNAASGLAKCSLRRLPTATTSKQPWHSTATRHQDTAVTTTLAYALNN